MSTESSKQQQILGKVREYYTAKILTHGPSPEGADWSNREMQIVRFEQALKLLGDDKSASVLDYGSGYGSMARHMREHGFTGAYLGFDISDVMVETAKREQRDLPGCKFATGIDELGTADYTITSGIFNVKHEFSDEEWLAYMLATIEDMAKHSRKGFSFNCLTSYSDPERMRPDLYYADPKFFFDYCMRKYSGRVALLHDYWWEFTMHVRLK